MKRIVRTKNDARAARVRAKVRGGDRPRLTVFRSNMHIWAQIVDDAKGTTIAAAGDQGLKGTKTERATAVGVALAALALDKKIKAVVFDRGSYRFHGRVKALAEAARKGGLAF